MKCLELEFKEEIEIYKYLKYMQPQNKTLQSLIVKIKNDMGGLVD